MSNYGHLDEIEDNGALPPMEDIGFLDPHLEDIEDEISHLEGFGEYARDGRGEILTSDEM
jgi:hypothetical protein